MKDTNINTEAKSFHEALLFELSAKACRSNSQVIDPELGVIDIEGSAGWESTQNFYGSSNLESSFRVHGFFHPR